MITKSAPTIGEMLLPEAAAIQIMEVAYHSLRGVGQPVPVMQPAVAEVAIFGSPEGLIETAQIAKNVGRESQIVRG